MIKFNYFLIETTAQCPIKKPIMINIRTPTATMPIKILLSLLLPNRQFCFSFINLSWAK